MLLTREEMTFNFQGAKFHPEQDRDILEWMFNQFLYGEITGIQVGHWLYAAPDLEAAKFLAVQAVEELQHVDNFLKIMKSLACKPKPAHRVIRFLATGMMGGSWEEHVSLEMATSEGFVLMALYALIDTLEHPPSVEILRRATRQEERHVAFGEQQTLKAIANRPGLRRRLAGLHFVSLAGVRKLSQFMEKQLASDHPVLQSIPAFLRKINECAELRMRRMGLIDRPLDQISKTKKLLMVAEAYLAKFLRGTFSFVKGILPGWQKHKRLTTHYLQDPHIRGD